MKPRTHLSIRAAILTLALLTSPALAAEPRWQPVGPYGHDGNRVVPSGDPDILYATTFYSGLYRSEDGGKSWRSVNPIALGALSVDPRDPDVLVRQRRRAAPRQRQVGPDAARVLTQRLTIHHRRGRQP